MSNKELKARIAWIVVLIALAIIMLTAYIIINHDATPLIVIAFFMIPVVLEFVKHGRENE